MSEKKKKQHVRWLKMSEMWKLGKGRHNNRAAYEKNRARGSTDTDNPDPFDVYDHNRNYETLGGVSPGGYMARAHRSDD